MEAGNIKILLGMAKKNSLVFHRPKEDEVNEKNFPL